MAPGLRRDDGLFDEKGWLFRTGLLLVAPDLDDFGDRAVGGAVFDGVPGLVFEDRAAVGLDFGDERGGILDLDAEMVDAGPAPTSLASASSSLS